MVLRLRWKVLRLRWMVLQLRWMVLLLRWMVLSELHVQDQVAEQGQGQEQE
jgi:hypothetical protein